MNLDESTAAGYGVGSSSGDSRRRISDDDYKEEESAMEKRHCYDMPPQNLNPNIDD